VITWATACLGAYAGRGMPVVRRIVSWLLAPPWPRCTLCQARGLPGTRPRLCLDCLADPTRGEDTPGGKLWGITTPSEEK
jgi:hypothetical protein